MKKSIKKDVIKGDLLKTTSCFKEMTGIYYEEFIESVLSPIIRDKFQFFSKNFSDTTIKKLLPLFELRRYQKGDLLIDENDFEKQKICFVLKGKISVFLKRIGKQIIILKSSEPFGVFSFFSDFAERYSYKVVDNSLILELKKELFLKIIKEESHDYEKFCQIRDQINLYKQYSSLHLSCYNCKNSSHILQSCPLLNYFIEIPKSPSPQVAIEKFLRKSKKKLSILKIPLLLQEKPYQYQATYSLKKQRTFYHKATFLSSLRGGTKTHRDQISYERFPSNFSSIKKNVSCPPISLSSCSNEILILNCMNSPIAFKKKTEGSQDKKSNDSIYNDVNESNRVYYDKHGETIEKGNNFTNISEIANSHRSKFSEKNFVLKSETNRTSEIVEEYSELMSKNSKIKKPSNVSGANSQRLSSYTNLEANYGFSTSSKNLLTKGENRSSRNIKGTYERKAHSTNSIVTQNQTVLKSYLEKISRTLERKEELNGFPMYQKPNLVFERLKSFKYYFPENNLENVISKFKK